MTRTRIHCRREIRHPWTRRIVVSLNLILQDEEEGEVGLAPSTAVGGGEISKAMEEDEAVTSIVMDEAEWGTAEVVVETVGATHLPLAEGAWETLIEMTGGKAEVMICTPQRQSNGNNKIEPSNLRRTQVLQDQTTPNLVSGERTIAPGTKNMIIDLDNS